MVDVVAVTLQLYAVNYITRDKSYLYLQINAIIPQSCRSHQVNEVIESN